MHKLLRCCGNLTQPLDIQDSHGPGKKGKSLYFSRTSPTGLVSIQHCPLRGRDIGSDWISFETFRKMVHIHLQWYFDNTFHLEMTAYQLISFGLQEKEIG